MKNCSRSEILAEYMLKENCTIRKCALKFGYSKSLVHLEVSKNLPKENPKLYKKLKKLLNNNFKMRCVRGGEATKQKYLNKKLEC